ncbi:MAG: hypothetical protein ACREK5_10235 [Gemmatimonadota bacterium]
MALELDPLAFFPHELLEEAIEDRDWRVRLLKAEPLFDALRSEPRFGRLLARAGFTE